MKNDLYLKLSSKGNYSSNHVGELKRTFSYIKSHDVHIVVVDDQTLRVYSKNRKVLLTLKGTQYLNHPDYYWLYQLLVNQVHKGNLLVMPQKNVSSTPRRKERNLSRTGPFGQLLKEVYRVTLMTGITFSLVCCGTVGAKMVTDSRKEVKPDLDSSEVTDTDATLFVDQELSNDLDVLTVEADYFASSDKLVSVHGIAIQMDTIDQEKFEFVQENYSTKISYYAEKYGLDPLLVMAVATQESGIHREGVSYGGAVGLMQIQKNVWIGESISAYAKDLETGAYQLRTISSISMDDLNCLETNIEIGCMYLQYCLRTFDYNITAGLQAYNYGVNAVSKLISSYANDKGVSYDSVVHNFDDLGWLDYRDSNYGDYRYVEHVLRYAANENGSVNLAIQNAKNGENYQYCVNRAHSLQ